MGEFAGAAFGFPGLVLTAAFVAAIGFWVLVLCRVVAPDAFDGDVDSEAWGLAGTSVAPAASVVIAAGWAFHLAGTVLLGRAGLSGAWFLLLSVALLPCALTLSWLLTRRLFGRRRRSAPSGAHRCAAGGVPPEPESARTAG
ncbi:hypothetical protein AB0E83_08360 [Streptomyces sp. NPDC035033]|uniref:hypothetical protein n=1 Tax=Streptomyces sp. NPDC035033 TaxID=3155368 RepID=UPI0033C524B5